MNRIQHGISVKSGEATKAKIADMRIGQVARVLCDTGYKVKYIIRTYTDIMDLQDPLNVWGPFPRTTIS